MSESVKQSISGVYAVLYNALKNDVNVMYEFPPGLQELPLLKPAVTVGLHSAEIIATDEAPIGNGKMYTSIDVKVLIIIPKSVKGNEMHSIFERVVTVFRNLYNVKKITCSEAKFSRNMGANIEEVHVCYEGYMYI